jgi:hypothetical protein
MRHGPLYPPPEVTSIFSRHVTAGGFAPLPGVGAASCFEDSDIDTPRAPTAAATINAKNSFPVADMWIFLNGISDLVQVHGTRRLAERCEKGRYLCYFGFHICSLRLTIK